MRVTNPAVPANWNSAPLSNVDTAPAAEALKQLVDVAAKVLESGFSDAPVKQGPVLDPDGSLPAVTNAAATGASEAPAGSVADRTLKNANAENDSINPMKAGGDGHYKGWDKLQSIIEQTTGWKPTDAEVQHIEPGHGASPGGKSWCGIWACHILQESGVNVKWDLTKGEMVGDVTHVKAPRFTGPQQYKAERTAFEQSIRPGDVITVSGKLNHHAIVTKVNPDGTVETMDGNKPHVGPGKQKLSDVTSYYRPNAA